MPYIPCFSQILFSDVRETTITCFKNECKKVSTNKNVNETINNMFLRINLICLYSKIIINNKNNIIILNNLCVKIAFFLL